MKEIIHSIIEITKNPIYTIQAIALVLAGTFFISALAALIHFWKS